MISYKENAEEYFDSAKRIKNTINKYREKAKMNRETSVNEDFVNDVIYKYLVIYHELMNTGNYLLRKCKED